FQVVWTGSPEMTFSGAGRSVSGAAAAGVRRRKRGIASPEEHTAATPAAAAGVERACGHSTQCTAVRSLAWVGEFSQRPSILAFATPVLASWKRYALT